MQATYAIGSVVNIGGTDFGSSSRYGVLSAQQRSTVAPDVWFNSETVPVTVGDATESGKTTSELQTPTGLAGIYANWNVDLDGDGTMDSPWDFGTSADYPVLKADRDNDGVFTWQEFGDQGRTEDDIPDAFDFPAVTAPAGTSVTSDPVVIAGVNVPVPIALSVNPSDAAVTCEVDGIVKDCAGGSKVVSAGQSVTLTATARANDGDTVIVTVNLGEAPNTVSSTWTLTTGVVLHLTAPQNLTAARTASAVVVEWDAVSTATSYIVQWKSGSEEFDVSRQAMPPDAYLTLNGLPAGRYTLRVAAVRNNVTGAWSDEVTTSTTTVIIAGGQSVNERDVRRGAPLATLGYTLTFSPAITAPVTVYYAYVIGGSTAQHTADFEYHQSRSSGVPDGPLLTALTAPEVGPVSQWVIDASGGSPVTTARIGVSILGDRVYEADETVQIRLLGATNAALGSTLDAPSTIVNDDPMPEIIVAAAVSGAEGATLEISVGLGANSETAVTVQYEDIGGGTATSGADYTAITAGTLTFPGLNAGSQKVTIQLTEDSAAEDDETINLRFHSASSNATLRGADNLGQLAVTVTIVDDDGNPAAPIFGAPMTDSLVVNWTAPSDIGGSAITSYDVQHRKANTSDAWTDGPQDYTDLANLTATIDGLDANTAYEVQVRAANSQGDGGWSASGFGSTTVDGAIFSGTLIVGTDTDAGVTTLGYRSDRSSGSLTPDGFNDGAAERRFASLAVVDVFEDWLLVSFNDAGSGTAFPGRTDCTWTTSPSHSTAPPS